MQDKDVTEKMLEKYNDVFADILNVLLFGGRNVVDEYAEDRRQGKITGKRYSKVLA